MKCIFLPFAGASKFSYNLLVKNLPSYVVPLHPELPGRGSRIREQLLYNIPDMVDDLYKQLEKEVQNGRYVLFGHSMGAILGYELIKLLQKKEKPLPAKLIVSGRKGLFAEKRTMYHDLPSVDFRKKLKELGGCPEEVLNSDILMDFFEPIIKADFAAVEQFNTTIVKINVPITVLHGVGDVDAENQFPQWFDVASQQVPVYSFPGKHFFIFSQYNEVIAILTQEINNSISSYT